tara:strand:+ start:59 stop:169 length:111 start_codon:yes stop_codon:yes gene_type:complete
VIVPRGAPPSTAAELMRGTGIEAYILGKYWAVQGRE